ncbi:hypothetical protein FQR65_LT01400 [Abscondita terminalis]|nr:hypothetical protein FQR65_LT01400 [Abscondita terminalis]
MFLINTLIKQIRLRHLHQHLRLWLRSPKYSTNSTNDVDKPIVYTTSPASKWKAQYSRQGTSQERLWYEPVVVLVSLTVFMVYFCILREESDIDQEFDKSLYSRVQGLEEQQLQIAIKSREDQGLDTSSHKEKLKELQTKS